MVNDLYGKVDISQDTVGGFAAKKPRITFDPSTDAGFVNMQVKDGHGKDSIKLNGTMHSISIGDTSVTTGISLDFENGARLALGATNKYGTLFIKNKKGQNCMVVNGAAGDIDLFDDEGKRSLAIRGRYDGKTVGMWIGAHPNDPGPKGGVVFIRNSSGNDSIILEGNRGDIILNNADCAEDFDILDSQNAEPGTVMVLESEGKLRQSTTEYDKKVAGVISGAGDCKPGIVLDKKPTMDNRKSVALLGKVYCKVDAELASIEVGDLLTTSYTAGHAMKAEDPSRAFGAVIGKSLRSLTEGKGLIPILIALQ
jgi:hypothetical protein